MTAGQRYLPLLDYLAGLCSLYGAFWLHSLFRGDVAVLRAFALSFRWLFVAPLLQVFLHALLGMYSRRSRSALFGFSRLVTSGVLTFFVFTAALFYLRVFFFPRLVILLWILVSFFAFLALRLPLFRKWQEERFFVLYRGERGRRLFEDLRRKSAPFGVVVGGTDVDALGEDELRRYLRRIVQDLDIDRVLLLLEPEEREKAAVLLREEGIDCGVQEALAFFEEHKGQIKLTLADLLNYEQMVKNNPYLTLKYALDRVVAGVLLGLLSPLLGLLALLVYLDSPGPVFYWQKRVGKDGRVFRLCKFRTMIPDAERTTGAVLAQSNDPRVTRVGRILRRTRLDELPQLLNVLRGEMSLVGPRPERPEFVERWKKLIPYYEIRLLVKPGITGWAQVRGRYDEGPETVWEKLEYDLYYLRNLSPSLDFEILGRTLLVMLLGKGAR
ncbi:exopolysaccharide biosynthesis polyprenyl glycosylphosphotransferase [Candidatus Caldatribacterium sp. SIUC1]|uniref:exopolysaccharide biosynthesis polyprenyl glycosylphosphotransferase n=1 Tax=Candidatus Caldatribacterium sp. SIUC1 TaxID=3418365 RepID=UPI003F6947FC